MMSMMHDGNDDHHHDGNDDHDPYMSLFCWSVGRLLSSFHSGRNDYSKLHVTV